jgi:hypothetical protein
MGKPLLKLPGERGPQAELGIGLDFGRQGL